MGRSYSIKGYLNAVARRSGPSLLVEGTTDKAVIHRLVAEGPAGASFTAIVDHASLVQDPELSGLGAKRRVLRIKAEADSLFEALPRLRSVLAVLVDREWDELSLDPAALLPGWKAPVQGDDHFVTMGHSMENYFVDIDCVVYSLKNAIPEHYGPSVERAVIAAFPKALALAGAFSFASHRHGCLMKVGGVVSTKFIEAHDGAMCLAEAAAGVLTLRGVPDALEFVRTVNLAAAEAWGALATAEHGRWLVHGHLGMEVLWAVIGVALVGAGVPSEEVERGTRGFERERRHFWQDWLARSAGVERTPLDAAVSWLNPARAVAGTKAEPGSSTGEK